LRTALRDAQAKLERAQRAVAILAVA
jgi:hypothetical protein